MGGPKNNVWTTVLMDDIVVATLGAAPFNIVQDTDWQAGAGQERATILRIRGWISVHNKTTTGVRPDGTWFAYICVLDEDAASSDASDPATYADEDILWTDGGQFTVTDTNASGEVSYRRIDVKSMRKIRVGQQCRLVFQNSSTGDMQISGTVRALMRKGGN